MYIYEVFKFSYVYVVMKDARYLNLLYGYRNNIKKIWDSSMAVKYYKVLYIYSYRAPILEFILKKEGHMTEFNQKCSILN